MIKDDNNRLARSSRRDQALFFWFGNSLVILLFDDGRENESIAVARYGADESRLAGVIAERAAERPDRLAQCAIGYDDIAPDPFEDLPPMHGLVATLDEKDQEVEVARDERQLASVADEQSSARGEDELVEPVAGHSRRAHSIVAIV